MANPNFLAPRRTSCMAAIGILAIAAFACVIPTAHGHAKDRPNFLIVLADDLGYGDLACYGHPTIKSPHLDRLARDRMRLTSCYAAAANCSPARCGLLTGRTPYRAGIYNWIPMFSPMHLFTSDNGPALTRQHPHGSAGPLREHKGWLYEGGIRVPGIVRWPGHVEPGSTSDEPVSGVDLLPTLCEIADLALPDDRALDGSSFLPVLSGGRIERRTPLYRQFNFARGEMNVALRHGDWKILARLDGAPLRPGADITAEQMKKLKSARPVEFELYHLKSDVGEERDLADEQPRRVAELAEKLSRMYRGVQKEAPEWPAWEWPRYEAGRIRWHPQE